MITPRFLHFAMVGVGIALVSVLLCANQAYAMPKKLTFACKVNARNEVVPAVWNGRRWRLGARAVLAESLAWPGSNRRSVIKRAKRKIRICELKSYDVATPTPEPTSTNTNNSLPTQPPNPTPPSYTPTPTPTPTPTTTLAPPVSGVLCDDGVDGDSDGLVDYADPDCFLVNGSEGTVEPFAQYATSSDSKVIYVSVSDGSDSNDGLSPHFPVRTIAKGVSLLRHGYPDWLLLRRGDTWDASFGHWKKSGRSTTEPMLIGSYGLSQERPILNVDGRIEAAGIHMSRGGGSPATLGNITIVGIHFRAKGRNPEAADFSLDAAWSSPAGLSVVIPVENLLVEDCIFEWFAGNAIMAVSEAERVKNLTIRHSQLLYNYSFLRFNDQGEQIGGGHSQGLYTCGIDGMLLEGNIFHHNGHAEDLVTLPGAYPTIFNHNLYLDNDCVDGAGGANGWGSSNNVVVRDNIITDASSHGLQLRPGGTVEGNIFQHNSIDMFAARNSSTIRSNIFLDPKDIDVNNPRGWGLSLQPQRLARVENNIMANRSPSVGRYNHHAFNVDRGSYPFDGEFEVIFENNIIYNWFQAGNTLNAYINFGTDLVTRVSLIGNTLQDPAHDSLMLLGNVPNIYSAGNSFETTRQENSQLRWGNQLMSFSDWTAVSDDLWVEQPADFINPHRDVRTYAISLGLGGSIEAFVLQSRSTSRAQRQESLRPSAVYDHISEGFQRAQ